MAVVLNKATESGDVIQIETNVPIIGITALSSFTDSTVGEGSGKVFFREFRYSLNGKPFTDWVELTNGNLAGVSLNGADSLILQYRYTRTGDNLTGDLEWNSVLLSTGGDMYEDGAAYKDSVFAQYFGSLDVRVLGWALNVLEKLYQKGLVPEVVERRKGDDDSHFLHLFRPTTIFFAYLVELGRVFEFFKNDASLADKYILNKGGYTCGEETLDQLIIVIINLLRVRSRRGTIDMYKKATDEFPVDGELLRVICWHETDYFKIGLAAQKYASWNIDNSSPEYNGLSGRKDLDSSYEQSENVIDLDNYPLILPEKCSIATDDTRQVLQIANVGNSQAGIGDASDPSDKIIIDPTLTYEISFYAKQEESLLNLTFGCKGFDVNGLPVTFTAVDSIDNNVTDFLTKKKLNVAGKWYFIRGIIYAHNTADDLTNPRTNIGVGQNMRFKSNCNSIIPVILVDNQAMNNNSYLRVWNLSINPLSTSYSRSYLDSADWFDLFVKNNNGSYSRDDLYTIFRKYFISYGCSFGVTHTGL